MKKEFESLKDILLTANILDENMDKCIFDNVMYFLNELEDKIKETEKRIECTIKISKEVQNVVHDFTEAVDKDEKVLISTPSHDKMIFGLYDIIKVLDLNNNDCIEENWYGIFPPKELKNIFKEDFIIWDKGKNAPKEKLDIVYHYTSLVELLNDGFKLDANEEIKSVKELPIKWQILIDSAIERTK
jgi:hypothetical protein